MNAARAVGVAATVAAAAVTVGHAAPALAGIGPLRRRLLPTATGWGHPGHVALTFDDGPHPEATLQVLRILERAGVQATFFLLGRALVKYPAVGRAIVAAGHEVGVHGHEHRLLLRRGPAATWDDIATATATIAEVTGTAPRWWRPPYGVATTAALVAARRLGLTPVWWTAWGRDWTRRATGDSVAETVLRSPLDGGTILLHDSDDASPPRSWESTVAALPRILTTCRARGLDVGPLREHGIRPGADGNLPDPGQHP